MKLRDLLDYHDIVIQCHDNPDADTIGAAFGVYQYLLAQGKKARIIYSGSRIIEKSNLKMMISELEIPVEYVKELDPPEMLITVDCQYEEGNVSRFSADHIAMIDHHEYCDNVVTMMEISPQYASCCTLVYAMLMDEQYDIDEDQRLSTALYFGLYMDSNYFGEIRHPYDFDLIEDLRVNEDLVDRLKSSNFTLKELEIAGIALTRYIYNEDEHYALVRSNPCDPNILGLISDLVLQVDCIDCSVVFCELDGNTKLSIRSCLRDTKASDLAEYLTHQIGNGGGHKKKAGGFIKGTRYQKLYGDLDMEEYLKQRIASYFTSFDVVDTKTDRLDIYRMDKYKKRRLPFGYVKSTELEGADADLYIHTMEGDVSICAKDDLYIMIGTSGEIYPIREEKLKSSYQLTLEPFYPNLEYVPKVKNRLTGKSKELLKYAKQCIPTGDTFIYARQLDKTTKVLSKWNYDNYMLGHVKDYIACRGNDLQDIYIINEKVFNRTYIRVEE